ncbi:[LSU ribosomal protein L11P]-lysine N-methyltransferase [Geothermobacter ehrlichii]|uniref:Ribosomal protein L11 methyltransferase n=1 Tax=Geothermobacter ehrlichii TaxID=213224 RepID=A0A5D3WH06_9BACT|nr:50S ribosomal protein L11 methyltransferase [Geothermobacter ehrlichii]TYO98106.1 [LSU ribosomal protein L11P]-lysine N-methyltransferase [Geothermobacter ehrlichii]
MQDSWYELTLEVPAEQVDLVSCLLTEAGAAGVITADRPLDTFVPPDPDQPETGPQTLRAYFPGQALSALQHNLEQTFAQAASWLPMERVHLLGWRTIGAQDWAEGWKQHFQPFTVGPLLIRPTWDPTPPNPEQVLLRIDPGMAFGTGSHATTRLCLEAVVAAATAGGIRSVLDVGTGSGILAIAAALLGAERVVGCDIDPDACRVAVENAELNKVGARMTVVDTPLEQIAGRFDLVLANILAEENIRLANELTGHLADHGSLVLSGILQERIGAVREAFDRRFSRPPEIRLQDEWACLTYRR